MARPANVAHAVLVGHLGAAEIFNTGFWYEGDTPSTDVTAAADAALIAGLVTSTGLKAAMAALMAADSALTEVRVYGYPTPGVGAAGVGVAAVAGGAGTTTGGILFQSCCVATLLSNTASRSGRGRMYFPADGAGEYSGHTFADAVVDNLADKLALLFDGINALAGGRTCVVMSPTKGNTHPVTQVRVNNKADVQRRHANKQIASHTRLAVL